MQACNYSTQEAEARESRFPDQPDVHTKTLSQKFIEKKEKKKRKHQNKVICKLLMEKVNIVNIRVVIHQEKSFVNSQNDQIYV